MKVLILPETKNAGPLMADRRSCFSAVELVADQFTISNHCSIVPAVQPNLR
jgi:hypothetical protein